MRNQFYEAKKYIELLILIILTVGPFPPTIKMAMYVIALLMNIKHVGALKRIKPLFFAIIVSMLIPMLLDIRNVDHSTPYSLASFAFLAPFIFSLVYIKEFEKREFLKKIENVIFFVTVVSLIGYLCVLVAPSIIERFPTIIYYGRKVKTIGIFGAIRDYTQVSFLHRNCGIAFEPGAYQFIPNLGLAITLSVKSKERDWKAWIRVFFYVMAVLSTYSSTGFVILAINLLIGSISNKKQFIITLVIIGVLSGALLTSYQYQIGKMQTGNFATRFDRTAYVLQNYAKYILGLGSTGYDKVYNSNVMIGSWDTFTNMYLRFGLLFTALLLIMCFKLHNISFSVLVTVFLSLMTESLIGPVVVMLFYYSEQSDAENKVQNYSFENDCRT